MTKSIQKILVLLTLVVAITSCQQKTFKAGYVNLGAIYQTRAALKVIDSLYQSQQIGLENYARTADQKVRGMKLSKEALAKTVKAYQDTLAAYKQQIEVEYAKKVNAEKVTIQTFIDSLSKQKNYDFVFSTSNNNILFVKDTTNNLTEHIIEALKAKSGK